MAKLPISDLDNMAQGAENNYLRFDEFALWAELMMHGVKSIDASAGGTITLVRGAGGNYLDGFTFKLTGTPAAAFNLDVPDGDRRFAVENASGKTVTVDTVTGSAVTYAVPDGETRHFRCSGIELAIDGDAEIAGRTAAAVDGAADSFLFWDASAGALRRVLGQDLPGGGGAGGSGAFPFRGALVKKSANQSIANATATAITFDQEELDTDAFHDNATNNTRLTIPAGVTKVRLYGGVRFATDASNTKRLIRFAKNGATFPGDAAQQAGSSSSDSQLSIASPVLAVTSGDFFELVARQDSGGALNVESSDFTYFGLEVVEDGLTGKTATVQTTDATQTVIAAAAMAADSAHTVWAYGHGREDATGDTYHFELFAGARNEAGTSSAPTPNVTEVADAGAATWDATLAANDTTDQWEIKVTGEAAHTIDWTVTYFTKVTQV